MLLLPALPPLSPLLLQAPARRNSKTANAPERRRLRGDERPIMFDTRWGERHTSILIGRHELELQ
jgi:hypothetical protein